MNGLQGGDPKKLALALVIVSDSGELALRFLDVMDNVERNLATIQGQIDAHATCRLHRLPVSGESTSR